MLLPLDWNPPSWPCPFHSSKTPASRILRVFASLASLLFSATSARQTFSIALISALPSGEASCARARTVWIFALSPVFIAASIMARTPSEMFETSSGLGGASTAGRISPTGKGADVTGRAFASPRAPSGVSCAARGEANMAVAARRSDLLVMAEAG